MDAAHLHLLTNHVPVFATLFSSVMLIWGLVRRDTLLYQLSLAGFIIAGVFSLVAVQTGEGAEDIVENLTGVSEVFIHDHEETAENANWIAIVLSIVSIGGFILQRMKPKILRSYLMAVLLLGLLSGGYMGYTSYLGGQIRHSEIRSDQNGNSPQEEVRDESEEVSYRIVDRKKSRNRGLLLFLP